MKSQRPTDATAMASALRAARRRLLWLIEDLDDGQLTPPLLPTVNPVLWEIGHVAWFQQRWTLRELGGQQPIRTDEDILFDSAAAAHHSRWTLPLGSRADVQRYAAEVHDAVLARLAGAEWNEREQYFHNLVLLHEDMHCEALLYTRMALGYAAPANLERVDPNGGNVAGEAVFAGGRFALGAPREAAFAFDNEQWQHEVEVESFRLARAPVTQREFAEFVDDRGYQRRNLWNDEGWRWRIATGASMPVYWRRDGRSYLRRHFDRERQLEDDLPVTGISWYEADAFSRWARRRLPTEFEWEVAALASPEPPINADLRHRDCVAVGADCNGSQSECQQLLGNVWEWTGSAFLPYPGFAAGPYREYSEPWFGTRRVLRGGSFATSMRLVDLRFRNYFTADRRDVLAGFRTAADV